MTNQSLELDLDAARHVIDHYNLQSVLDRLVQVEGWRRDDAEEALEQYRHYLFLRKKYPNVDLPPSEDIDDVWHAHILHTADYRRFCAQVFPECQAQYLDHDPHLRHAESVTVLQDAFKMTQKLYFEEFGDYLYAIKDRTCWDRWRLRVADMLLRCFPNIDRQQIRSSR